MTKQSKTAAAPDGLLRNMSPALEQQLGPIEYRAPDALTAYKGNPRKHPEQQIVQLMASMREFGFALPLLVDVDGVLVTGHARLEAARRLGMKSVPVIVAEHWSKAQVKAYRLADNQLATAATWDEALLRVELAGLIELDEMPIEVLGWSTGEIDVILSGVDEVVEDDGDDVPEPPLVPTARTGDLWRLGKHRLVCGSSLEPAVWARLMAGEIGSMILTDAPFNCPVNGHVSGSGRFSEFAMASGEMTQDEFIQFNATYLTNMCAHLKDGAVVMAFMDHHHLFELMTAARNMKLKHLNLCVWAKTNAGMGSLYRSQHELVLVLKYGMAPHTNCVNLGRDGRWRSNVWQHAGANVFSATRDADLSDHPTVKPKALLAEAIRDVTRPNEIVLDAFCGSGSTILACELTKRIGYAVEIEPRYIDVAIRRWEAMTGRQAVLEESGEAFAQVAAARAVEAPPQLAA